MSNIIWLFDYLLNSRVAQSVEEYAAIAVTNASKPDDLRQLHHALAATIANSASGDRARYTRAVEQAYRAMWEEYCGPGIDAASRHRSKSTAVVLPPLMSTPIFSPGCGR